MAKSKSVSKRKSQPNLPEYAPNYDHWREIIGNQLKERPGSIAEFARTFGVAPGLASDWFTLRRTHPPAHVVWFVMKKGGVAWL